MGISELLNDIFGRVRELVPSAVDGLDDDQLATRPEGTANSIAWLIWHLTRVQDDHVAGAAGTEQVWVSGGWAKRFGLPEGMMDHGYGHASDQVEAVAEACSNAAL